MSLADQIRKSREQWVTAQGKEFLLRRPTKLQIATMGLGQDGKPWVEIAFACTVDWKVLESDLIPGGGGRVAPFDSDAFREYASDQPELLVELSNNVHRMIETFDAKREEVSKN